MTKTIDVRNNGGSLAVVGTSLVLPSDPSTTVPEGSVRYNPTLGTIEIYTGSNWTIPSSLPFSQVTTIIVGAVVYQGVWDASANSPQLTSSTGTKGYYYKVSVTGNTELDGVSSWGIGDTVIFNGNTWDKIIALQSEIISVAGRTGNIVLSVSDISGAAPLNSPTFTGTVEAPTPQSNDNSTAVATTSYVKNQGYIHNNQTITLDGAVNGSGTTSIATSLAPIASNSILANTLDGNGAPIATNLTELLDSVLGITPGSILYRNNNVWTVLTPGSNGQFLQYNENLNWEDAVLSFNSRSGAIELSDSDVYAAIGFVPLRSGADVATVLGYTPLNPEASGLSTNFGGSALIAPYVNGQILLRVAMGFAVTFLAGLPNSTAVCLSPASTNVVLPFSKNGTNIGTITFLSGAKTGTFTLSTSNMFEIGDILELDAPNPADSMFGNLTFTFVGIRN